MSPIQHEKKWNNKKKKKEDKVIVLEPLKDLMNVGVKISNFHAKDSTVNASRVANKMDADTSLLHHYILKINMTIMSRKCCIFQKIKPLS